MLLWLAAWGVGPVSGMGHAVCKCRGERQGASRESETESGDPYIKHVVALLHAIIIGGVRVAVQSSAWKRRFACASVRAWPVGARCSRQRSGRRGSCGNWLACNALSQITAFLTASWSRECICVWCMGMGCGTTKSCWSLGRSRRPSGREAEAAACLAHKPWCGQRIRGPQARLRAGEDVANEPGQVPTCR